VSLYALLALTALSAFGGQNLERKSVRERVLICSMVLIGAMAGTW